MSTIYIKGPQRPCLVPVTEIRHLAVPCHCHFGDFFGISTTGAQYRMRFGSAPGASRHPSRAKLTSRVLSVTTLNFDGFSTCRVVFTILVTHHGSLRHFIPGAQYRLVPSTRPRNVGGGNPKTPHFYSFECDDTKCPGSPHRSPRRSNSYQLQPSGLRPAGLGRARFPAYHGTAVGRSS